MAKNPVAVKTVTAEVQIWRSRPNRISIAFDRETVANVTEKAGSAYKCLDDFLRSRGK